ARHAGFPRRAPTPLAGDQLVAPGGPRADDDRLEHALGADRAGEPGSRLRLEAAARLPRVGMDHLDGEMRELGRGLADRAADQDVEAAPQPAARATGARQAPSPPSSRRL